ncbi:ABC transporter substrate-binding protein [Tepidibacillus marianensis]|uniref:ABC transporter substrate-binding protein n=1 Tax=Tepidibacillus marianensis TaxID=3131995 RepID=UPI0030CE1650
MVQKWLTQYQKAAAFFIIIIVSWEFILKQLAIPSYIMPTPIQILQALWRERREIFFVHLPVTLFESLIGLFVSVFVGFIIAWMMHFYKNIEQTLYPWILISQMIPIIVISPIVIMWFGYGLFAKIFIIFLISFFPVSMNAFQGLQSVNQGMISLLQSYGASRKQIFFKIEVPHAIPSILTGIRMAAVFSIVGATLGEWLGSDSGLGYYSRRMSSNLQADSSFAAVVNLVLLGLFYHLIMQVIERKFLKNILKKRGKYKMGQILKSKWIVLFLTLIIILTGCSTKGNTTSGNKEATSQKLRVMLDWYPNAVHSFLYVAQEKGYFKEQGIEVEFVMPAETNDPLRLVAARKIDLALTYQPEIISANDKGIPVVSVASIVNHPLNVLLVPKDSSILSPKDLEGKTIGYPSIPMNEALVGTMIKHDGGDPQKIKMVDVGWDLMPAISTKKVDAMSGGFLNHEEILLNKEGFQVREFYPTKYGVPDYSELMLVTSQTEWKEKSDLIQKFWKAAQKGQEEVKENPKASLEILMKQQRKEFPLDSNVETQSLAKLLPLMEVNGHEFGWQNKQQWEKVQQWLYEYKLIQHQQSVDQMFTIFIK